VPGPAALAVAAGAVVDERDAPAVRLRDHLVSEDRARGGDADLLDVRSAEPAGEHANELRVSVGLRHVRERRLSLLVEDDRAHGSIVGPWGSSSTGVRSCG